MLCSNTRSRCKKLSSCLAFSSFFPPSSNLFLLIPEHHHLTHFVHLTGTLSQLYELSEEPKRKEFLDDLFTFMQKRVNWKTMSDRLDEAFGPCFEGNQPSPDQAPTIGGITNRLPNLAAFLPSTPRFYGSSYRPEVVSTGPFTFVDHSGKHHRSLVLLFLWLSGQSSTPLHTPPLAG
ncbi:unnamed protein product [Protopolystoma xenopodis]|uniref:Uncharacterized protein n=1 Tax=Protopolystoma xenopodis TaxID=117903 RepID=A0A3S5CPJ2_9PLAT|nr:unnamed protein product [Protopolystoma xenopodis]